MRKDTRPVWIGEYLIVSGRTDLKKQHDEIHREKVEISQREELLREITSYLDKTCGDMNLTCHLNMTQGFYCEETKCFRKIDEIEAIKNMKVFKKRINHRLYKNAYQRFGKQISIVPSWLERGTEKHDLHFHCLISIPEDRFQGEHEEMRRYRMEQLIKTCWFETPFGVPRQGRYNSRKTLSPSATSQRVRVDWQHENSIFYLSKFRTKSDLSLIDWENFHWNQYTDKTLLN